MDEEVVNRACCMVNTGARLLAGEGRGAVGELLGMQVILLRAYVRRSKNERG